MDREFIISEIKRLARQNGGQPPGVKVFEKQTGIKTSDWYGKFWARWNDAVAESGFDRKQLTSAYDTNITFTKYAEFIRELGHWPVTGEIRLKATNDAQFPYHNTLDSHLGKQSERAKNIVDWCREKGGFEDVIEICHPHIKLVEPTNQSDLENNDGINGFVYLVKSGKRHKIGKTNNLDRRQYEIGLHLPDELIHIHSIETDDPAGIEAYWHNRFKSKRLRGEWFELSSNDVKIFRRRRFM